MPQDQLLDAIYNCFRQYTYCSLKFFRNRLHQPEAYIKSTLENIATLVRSGDFAMNYVLKPEYASIANINADDVKEELALNGSDEDNGTDLGGTDGMSEGEDEDDGEDFEDVKMGDA